jgi:hypothetical protein|eukprot:COSAG06_NODE_1655_length_8787_cov_4.443255_7_plen_66_part_00
MSIAVGMGMATALLAKEQHQERQERQVAMRACQMLMLVLSPLLGLRLGLVVTTIVTVGMTWSSSM